MNPEELAEAIAQLIAGAEQRFTSSLGRIQEILFRRLSNVVKNLQTDSQGYILQSSANRTILQEAEGVFNEVVQSGAYQKAVVENLSVVPEIDTLNQRYFETVSESFKLNRVYLKSLQGSVIRDLNVKLLQDGLTASVRLPLNQILNQNVNVGGSFSGMLDQLRQFVTGGENEGRLLRYSRGILTDTLFNYSRAYQQAVVSDLGLSWYFYSGGLMDKSRPFCIERSERYFHQKEIESWASMDWAGKNPNTTESSIFIYVGGANCRHSLIPVHENSVPKEAIDRLSTNPS